MPHKTTICFSPISDSVSHVPTLNQSRLIYDLMILWRTACYKLKLHFSAVGWEWLINLTERITIGRQVNLSVGDLLLKLVTVAAQIYEPLLQLVGQRLPQTVMESSLYRHPHAINAAESLMKTGQFSHCEDCRATDCPINVLYCRLFCSVYFFVTNLKGLTDQKFGVGSVSKLIFLIPDKSRFLTDFIFRFFPRPVPALCLSTFW